VGDAGMITPSFVLVTHAGQTFPALKFALRKRLTGLAVTLESSSTLAGQSWMTEWSIADATTAGLLVERVDAVEFETLTVRSAIPLSAVEGSRNFLRLKVTLLP